jgi:hypothetical protein
VVDDAAEGDVAVNEPYQDRMLAEWGDVSAKIHLLEVFRGGDVYRELPEVERDRLTAQLMFMRGYAEILRQRIKVWKLWRADDPQD